MKNYNIIAAVDEEFGIGKDGDIPWSVPADFQFFKSMTYGCSVVIGRKTFENTGPLPGRHFFVLSSDANEKENEFYGRDENSVPTQVTWLPNFDHVTNHKLSYYSCQPSNDIWVAGGESIYEHYVGACTNLYLSHIPGTYDCDKHFPSIDEYSEVGTVPAEGFSFTRYVKNDYVEKLKLKLEIIDYSNLFMCHETEYMVNTELPNFLNA